MAVSKLGSSAAGGALAGAQIGSVVPGVGTLVGAGVGAVGGLLVGALQKDTDLVKSQRMQKRVEKLRGKGDKKRLGGKSNKEKARELEKRMLTETGATGALTKEVADRAKAKVVGDTGPMVVQSGSDPTAGQQRLSDTAGTDLELQGQQQEEQQALVQGMAAASDQRTAMGQLEDRTAALQEGAAMTAGGEASVAAHADKAMATGAQIGQIGSSVALQARSAQMTKGMNPEATNKAKGLWRDDGAGNWAATTGVAKPGEAGYATNKQGQFITPKPLGDDLKDRIAYDPVTKTGSAVVTVAQQQEAYKQAVKRAKTQTTAFNAERDYWQFLAGYRPTSGYGPWTGSGSQQGTSSDIEARIKALEGATP